MGTPMNTFRALVCLALALTGGGVFAQVNASDTAFQKFFAQVTGVGKQTIGFGSGGQLVVGQGVPQISTAGGPVLVDRSIPVLNNSGGQIAANARVSVPPAVLGRILRRGLVAVPVLGTGIALYDIAVDLGFTPTREADGSTSLTFASSGGEWRYNIAGTPWVRDYLQGCKQIGSFYVAARFNSFPNANTIRIDCSTSPGGGSWTGQNFNYRTYTDPPQPSTLEDFEAAVAARSGWPSGSRVSQAVADATALQPADPFTATPEVTGPATSPGDTSTTENPDGSTTTKTTTYNHTYTGPTINTTTQTITSTCTGGSCNTTTTTETPKIDEQPFTMPCGVPGTPACAVAVDETGMPTADDLGTDGPKDAEEDYESWIQGIAAANPFPDINWAFELPTACGVIPTPAFEPFMASIDVCQWQPMFHELMTVVWMLGGLFGAISLFMRNSLAT